MDIVVNGLTKKYGDKVVLDRLDLRFREGEITAILGKSGVGKTTLLRCVASLTPYEGKIEGAEEGVSYVFQEDRLIPHLTVYDNLAFTAGGGEERRRAIREMIAAVELEKEASRLPSTLSGGQKKRVALARAFLSPRKVLLMDEPFASLDVGLKSRLRKVFFSLHAGFPKTVLFVTHDGEEAISFADRVLVLGEKGPVCDKRIPPDRTTRDVTSAECNEIRRKILSALEET
ncbi:MAG: ABC transporter ATP-binding protein [Candidatus Borkfalkiaceae bacterium]|nr:ABC transporter ATP-binding protein [Christensenellaceae bacterium]